MRRLSSWLIVALLLALATGYALSLKLPPSGTITLPNGAERSASGSR